MKLENLPEIKKGMRAEIGYITPKPFLDDNGKPIFPRENLQYCIYYVDRIVYLKPEQIPMGYVRNKKSSQEVYPVVRVFQNRYRKSDGKFRHASRLAINIDAIVKFTPLEPAKKQV